MERKQLRLKGWDYSNNGAYFITICTKDRKKILSKITVGEGLRALPILTATGKEIEKSICYLNKKYNNIIEKYVIMPNHIHMIIYFKELGGHGNPPLQDIIRDLKSFTTHKFGDVLWQRSYYDHILRNQQDYEDAWNYIDGNPAKWKADELY
ncbi:MAG: transposase [Clostridiales bacterium]|nr:transposase [Clostridiales bacterium]